MKSKKAYKLLFPIRKQKIITKPTNHGRQQKIFQEARGKQVKTISSLSRRGKTLILKQFCRFHWSKLENVVSQEGATAPSYPPPLPTPMLQTAVSDKYYLSYLGLVWKISGYFPNMPAHQSFVGTAPNLRQKTCALSWTRITKLKHSPSVYYII